MKKIILLLSILISFSACHNQDIEFPDYDYSAVYFAYQYPVRTITLGEDIYNTDLDNQHKCKIFATMGGVYDNKHDVTIDVVVADSICTGFSFASLNRSVLPLPHDYYNYEELKSSQIIIKKGEISGGVEVKFTDAFFADQKALANNYVIPLLMTKVTHVDSVLHGKPVIANTNPRKLAKRYWDVLPKDYVLYAVKYINPWHGYYLRRGVDILSGGLNKTIVRHPADVSTYDAATVAASTYLNQLTTLSLKDLLFPVTLKDASGNNFVCNLKVTIDDSGNCNVTSNAPAEYTVNGTGKYVAKGEKNSWGNKDRDVMYLDYTINHIAKGINVATRDTLVMRNRGVTMETFSVTQ